MLNFQVQPNQQDCQEEHIHLPKETCVISGLCIDISSSALTGRLGGTKSGARRDVHQVVVARTNYHCLDFVCFEAPNQ